MAQLIDLGKIRFYFAGTWDEETQYELNDVVKYGGNVYVYTYGLATDGHLPTDTNYWALMIEGLKFTGVWDSLTEYRIGDGVAHGGKVYIAVKTGSNKVPPNTEYWSQFADGIQYEGAYSNTKNYQKNDVVTYGGSVYIAKQDGVGNNPTAAAYWDPFVSGVDATGVWNAGTAYVPNQLVAYGARIYISLTNNTNKTPSQNPTDWVTYIDGIRAMGNYNPATQYHVNDIVIYGGTAYIAKGDTLGNVPSDTDYWDTFSAGIKYRSTYNPTTQYVPNDVVLYGSTVYVAITEALGIAPGDEDYWEVLTSGTTYRGEWTATTQYLSGDIVNWGGSTYITQTFHSSTSSFAADKALGYWTKYNSGIRYRGEWAENTLYIEGDVVSDGENARIAITDHTSSEFLVDDEEYWEILAKGATGLLPSQGGRAGYVLTTDGAEASFERDVTNLYFGDGARDFIEGPAALTDVATAAAWDAEGFAQAVVINNLDLSTGDGSEQSADFIAYTSGSTNDAGWADLGFTGPEFDSATYGITGPSDGYVFATAAPSITKTVTNVELLDNVVTLTTGAAHGFTTGKTVDVTGAGAQFNGRYVITGTPSTTTFTYAKTGDNYPSTALDPVGSVTMYVGKGNLVLSTGDTGSNNDIVFAAGGFASGNTQMKIIPDTTVHIDIATQATSPSTGALTVAGGVGVTGNQYIQGNLTVLGNVDLQGVTKLPVGAGATEFEEDAELTDAVVIAAGTSASFVQNAIVNLGNGLSSSADYIAYAGEGTNVSGWIDMGITNASFDDPSFGVTGPHDGYIFMSAPTGTTGKGNLVLATDNTGTDNKIVFAAGGLGTGNEQMIITPNQNVHVEIETPSTSATTGAFTVVGGVGILGDLSFDGLMRTQGSLYFGDGAEAFEADAELTNARAVFVVEGDPYAQVAVYNPTPTSSGDILVYADNGDDLSGWIDMGITGSQFEQAEFGVTGPNDGYIFFQAPEGTTGEGNLVIATGDGGTQNKIVFAAGGFVSGNTQMTITPDVNVHIEIATPSISPTTGALTVVGGVGVLGDMNIQGSVNISGQISFAGGGTTVETENLAVTDPVIFVANGNTAGDSQDFAFLGQTRTQQFGTTFGPFTVTHKQIVDGVATVVISGGTNAGMEEGDIITVTNVDPTQEILTSLPIVYAVNTNEVVTITTSQAHNFVSGDTVTLTGVNAVVNGGPFTITGVPTSTTFTFTKTGAPFTAPSPATVGGVATVTRNLAAVFNGTFTVTDLPTATSFKYAVPGKPNVTYTPTTKTFNNYVTAFSITDGVATLVLANALQAHEIVGSTMAITGVRANLNGNKVLTAVDNTAPGFSVSYEVELDDEPLTQLGSTVSTSITSRNRQNNIVTLTTAAPHNFIIGESVTVAGVSATFNGTFTIKDIPSPTTFQYDQTDNNVTETASTGTATTSRPQIGFTETFTTNNGSISSQDPFRGVYTGLARNHVNGEWYLLSGLETRPTLTLDFQNTTPATLRVQDLRVQGGDLTTEASTFNILQTSATTVNAFGGTVTTLNAAINTVTQTVNIATGTTASGNTKTINIGSGGVSGSTTAINIGATNGGTTTISGTAVLVTEQSTDMGLATKRYADMRPAIITAAQTLVQRSANNTGYYMVNHTAPLTLTLPASPALGDRVTVADIANAAINNITLGRNSQPIQGKAEDLVINVRNATVELVYASATLGWMIIVE